MNSIVGLLWGLLVGAGVVMLAVGLSRSAPAARQRRVPLQQQWIRLTRRPPGRAGRRRDILWVSTAVGAVVLFAVTGWALALLVVPVLVLALPWLLADTNKVRIERTAALEMWIRSLRSILVSGTDTTLEAALVSSLANTPPAIRPEVSDLAARIQSRQNVSHALVQFSDDLDDPTADTVVAALIMAAQQRSGGLLEILEALSEAVTDEVEARRKIEGAKATPRAAARFLTVGFAAIAGLMALTSPEFLRPYYASAVGEVLLALIITAYLAVLYLVRRVATVQTKPRLHPTVPTSSEISHV